MPMPEPRLLLGGVSSLPMSIAMKVCPLLPVFPQLGVAVAVLVASTGVDVLVGGTAVRVAVLVGGTAVAVLVGGTGVAVRVGVFGGLVGVIVGVGVPCEQGPNWNEPMRNCHPDTPVVGTYSFPY